MNSKKSEGIRMCDLEEGTEGIVAELLTTGNLRRRLQDLGIVEGARVVPMLTAASGNPKAYEICSAVISVRRQNAKDIIVIPVSPNTACLQ